MTPRRWQCLTLVVHGLQSDLYLNGVPVSRQTWNRRLEASGAPVHVGSIDGLRNFLNAKLAAFSIYGEPLSAEAVQSLYRSGCDTYRQAGDAHFPENDFFRLKMAPGGGDEAEVPGEVILGPGVQAEQDAGRPVFTLDGRASYLLVLDSPRERLFSKPYAFILDFRPDKGACGMLFRRHHAECLSLEPDGTLVFDANIGRNDMLRFVKAVKFDAWNRIVLTYDGHTASMEINGVQAGRQVYEGSLYEPGEFPVVFLADNTHFDFPKAYNVRCKVRELRVAPRPADVSEHLGR
jgi:hypothetical protein